MKILLTGGGTAGHVNPALAIAATIKEAYPDAEILFAASALAGDKANDLVPRAGYELRHVHIRGLRRPVWSLSNLKLPFVMLRSRREAKAIIRAFSPDLIVGTGGFACWPVVSVGASMGIPTVVHESNALPGKAIMQVKEKVDKILVNFPETADRLALRDGTRRVVRVGNPHMPDFVSVTRTDARARLGLANGDIYILSFGGSLGAEGVNDAVCRMVKGIVDDYPNAVLYHATGKRDHDRCIQELCRTGADKCPRVTFVDYIYDMPLRMAAADLVICRAGAMTVSELALTGKAAILIPSPHVAENHQLKNAQALSRVGAGVCVEEKALVDGELDRAVRELLDDAGTRARMGETVKREFACPEANDAILRELVALIDKK